MESVVGRGTVLADLRAEGDELDRVVAGLDDDAWATPTPSPGWAISHQIAHLAWADERALLAVTDKAAFAYEVERALSAPDRYVDDGAREGGRGAPGELLARWRERRSALAAALAEVPAGTRLPWFGPPMGAGSMAAARLMEIWAHGQDVVDALEGQRRRDNGVAAPPEAQVPVSLEGQRRRDNDVAAPPEAQVPVSLGVSREPTARLWHIARLGVQTRDLAFRTRRLAPPAEPFRVELTAPDGALGQRRQRWRDNVSPAPGVPARSLIGEVREAYVPGELWVFGPEDARQRVTGPALGFCLLVTQRRHRDDTGVTASGADADTWLSIAQAFAGPSGAGRPRRVDAALGVT